MPNQIVAGQETLDTKAGFQVHISIVDIYFLPCRCVSCPNAE